MAYLSQVKLGNSTYDISAIKLKNARTIQTNLASVSSASFDGTANITPGVTGILAIANGGTNANSAKQARVNLLSIGSNPITTVEDDTVANWGSYGPCATAFYSATGQLTDQPAQWGFVHNIMTSTSSEVHQLWTTQAGGDIYHRGGNASGWATSWKKLLDSSNFNSYAPTLTGTGATGTWGISISGNAATATKATKDGSGNTITSKYVTVDTAQTISGTKTMTGSLKVSGRYAGGGDDEGIVIGFADNGFAGLCLGGPSVARSVFYLKSDGTAPFWRYNNGSASYDISHPSKSGTIALTSDLANYLPLSGGTITNGSILFKRTTATPTSGQQMDILRMSYQNADGTYYGNSTIIAALGTGETGATNNTSVRFGSPTGSTWITSGESGTKMPAVLGTNNEVLYLTSDASTQFYNGCANDGTSYTKTMTVDNSKITAHVALYGAVWNDYAEFRTQKEIIEPGYCVASSNNGQVYKTTEKFQACDGIVSDTFGFAIGETDECKTPLAVAGRVLAYYSGNRDDYQAGDTVCAGPGGKVMKMTREEIKTYPDRIVGIVSEIPEYEIWGTGNIEVNNRIWIKVK